MATGTYKGLHDRDGLVRTETVAYQIAGINNQITDDFGASNDLEVTGGGRGWTATTTIKGEVHSAKSTSKLGAAEALYAQIKHGVADLLQPDDMSDAEFTRCVSECVTSRKPYCNCKCGGANHGAANGTTPLAVIGPKLCLCGCGGTTKRLFVPGHDARYHAAQKRSFRALDLAVSLDELAVIERNERLAAAKAKRAAKKAALPKDGASAKTDA